jgi:hypothetical protein
MRLIVMVIISLISLLTLGDSESSNSESNRVGCAESEGELHLRETGKLVSCVTKARADKNAFYAFRFGGGGTRLSRQRNHRPDFA